MGWWERAEEEIPADSGPGRLCAGTLFVAGLGGLVFFGGLIWTAYGWLAG